jgi:hypothetical protein
VGEATSGCCYKWVLLQVGEAAATSGWGYKWLLLQVGEATSGRYYKWVICYKLNRRKVSL